jgi:cell division protein FtsW
VKVATATGGSAVTRRGDARPTRGTWTSVSLLLVVTTLLLVLLGLLMSFSASFVDAAQEGDAFRTFRRQGLWTAFAVPAFLVAARVPVRALHAIAWPAMLGSILALVLVLVPGVGLTRSGSTRWLGAGPFVFQPSEVAKLALLLWLAHVLERKRPSDGMLQTTSHLLIPAVPALVLLGGLVLLQPDLGTTVLLALIVAAIVWVEGISLRVFAGAGFVGLAAVTALAFSADYRSARIRGWLAPEEYPLGEGFQLLQSYVALGSGGLTGVGLGSSRGKWNFVPNPETDFVFAIIGEELGLVGAGVIVLLFVVLLIAGLHVAFTARYGFDRTVAFAITTWISGQAFVNIGTVTGLLPITGVTLPLVSAGGSSLMVTLVALGLLVNVARRPAPDGGR